MVEFTSNDKKDELKWNDKWQVNVCEYAGNRWFIFFSVATPVARNMGERRILSIELVVSCLNDFRNAFDLHRSNHVQIIGCLRSDNDLLHVP